LFGKVEMSKERSFLKKVDSLTDALGRSEEQSLDEVKKELEFEGIDPAASVDRLMETVHKCSRAAKRQALDRAREERLRRESKSLASVNRFVGWTREQLLKRLREMESFGGAAVAASFRDLNAKSEEDLISLLEDLERAQRLGDEESGNDI
jgi:hypothetical protein